MIEWQGWDILFDKQSLSKESIFRNFDLKTEDRWSSNERKDLKQEARAVFGQRFLFQKRKKQKGLRQYGNYDSLKDWGIGELIRAKLETNEGFSQSAISHIENGRRWPTDLRELEAIANVYELDPPEKRMFYLLAKASEPSHFDLEDAHRRLKQISRWNKDNRFQDVLEEIPELENWLLSMLTPFDPLDQHLRKELKELVANVQQELKQAKQGLEVASQVKSVSS